MEQEVAVAAVAAAAKPALKPVECWADPAAVAAGLAGAAFVAAFAAEVFVEVS